jgi:HPt (histidine-containing phosphotransfer) domain-containing protein
LKREFLVEAEGKVNEIRSRLETPELSKEDLDRMVYLAHQLKGAGGSYGFQTISTESTELERELEEAGNSVGDDRRTTLLSRVEKIASTIQSSARELAV